MSPFWTWFLCYSCAFELLCDHEFKKSTIIIIAKAYSESSQTSKIKLFVKIIIGFQISTIFAKKLRYRCLDMTPNSPFYIKSDTCGSLFDFNFSHRILVLKLMDSYIWPISIKANYSKNIFNCLNVILNLRER